jgi:hypothetical protein
MLFLVALSLIVSLHSHFWSYANQKYFEDQGRLLFVFQWLVYFDDSRRPLFLLPHHWGYVGDKKSFPFVLQLQRKDLK